MCAIDADSPNLYSLYLLTISMGSTLDSTIQDHIGDDDSDTGDTTAYGEIGFLLLYLFVLALTYLIFIRVLPTVQLLVRRRQIQNEFKYGCEKYAAETPTFQTSDDRGIIDEIGVSVCGDESDQCAGFESPEENVPLRRGHGSGQDRAVRAGTLAQRKVARVPNRRAEYSDRTS